MHTVNLNKDTIETKHSELKRWTDDSVYKSECPVCDDGVLLIMRDKNGILEKHDRCINCGQAVIYTDIEELRKLERK